MSGFAQVNRRGSVPAETLQKQPLLIEHADLLVLDITDIDIVIDRCRNRPGTVEFTGITAGLGKQLFELQVRVENANLAVILGDDDQLPVGEHIDTAEIIVLERRRRQAVSLDFTIGNFEQGAFFRAGDIDYAIIGYLQPAGVFHDPGVVLGFDEMQDFERIGTTDKCNRQQAQENHP